MAHTHKMVNGKSIRLTAAEIAAFDARDAAWRVKQAEQQVKRQRHEQLTTEVKPAVELLATATAAEIDDWFAANVTDSTQAIAVLKTVCKMLAVQSPPAEFDM